VAFAKLSHEVRKFHVAEVFEVVFEAAHHNRPSSSRPVTYLTMIAGVTCGMPSPGGTFRPSTAARNRFLGAIDPRTGT
jgi:hypothetical protein